MPSNIEIIHAFLVADPVLVGTYNPSSGYSGHLKGGIWTRPIKREGAGATPEAFSSAHGRPIRTCAALVDSGENAHSQSRLIPTSYLQTIDIWFYTMPTATGKEELRQAQRRIALLLDGWTFDTDDGYVGFVRYISRRGMLDSESFIGAVDDYCRYEVVSRRSDHQD